MKNSKLRILEVAILFLAINLQAQNPIITDIYTADPTAMVYGDSVYIYTGHDEASASDDGYKMNNWHIFSSADMVNWTDHGAVLKVADFGWASRDAWASHTIERNGKFYWYVTLGPKTGGAFSIGVAVADSPIGPFIDAIGAALITDDMTSDVTYDIDPAVFIDDDNQAYLYWGNGGVCKAVKLKENMIELDGEITNIPVANFTEAVYMHKKDGTYYLTYASGWPERINYSTSTSPLGPFTDKGMLNDYVSSSTNHQAVIEFKNQWYFIYHTGAIGGDFQRSVAIEYLYYNADGTIKEIVQTSQGVAELDGTCMPLPVDAYVQVNGGAWNSKRKFTLREGESIIFNPETAEEGTWSWIGPNDFIETDSIVTLNNIHVDQSGIYRATFTNSCGTDSYMSFDVTVKHGVPSAIESGKIYIIKPKGSEMVVSVKNSGVENGSEVEQSTFTNGAHQQWKISNVDNYYWSISPTNSPSRGIDVNNFSQDDNAKIQIWDYWGGETQQWEIVETNTGVYQIMARHSGKCLDVESTVLTENARVRQWTCNDSERQLFTIVDADANVGFHNLEFQRDIIISNASDSNGISFDISQFDQVKLLAVIDISGKVLYETQFVEQGIISPNINLKTGVFIVKLQDKQGTFSKKFIVK